MLYQRAIMDGEMFHENLRCIHLSFEKIDLQCLVFKHKVDDKKE